MLALWTRATFALLALALLAFADAHANGDEPPQTFRLPTTPIFENVSIDFGLGAASQEVSKLTQGTVILPGAELPLARLDGRLLTTRFDGGLHYDWGEACCAQNVRTSFSFATSWGDDSVSRRVEPGGVDTAITWFENAPSGSTGVNLGNTGLFAYQGMEFESHDLRLRTAWQFDACDAADVTLSPDLSLAYGGREQIARGTAVSTLDPNISSLSDQRVEDHYYGVGFGLTAEYQLTPRIGLYGNAGMDFLYNEAKLRTSQSNRCGNPGCPPADNQFAVQLRDHYDGFAFGGRLEGGATYQWDRLRIRGVLGFDYLTRRSEARNPTSPPVANHDFLESRNAIEPRFAVNVSYAF